MSLIRHTSLNYHPNYHAHTTYPPIHRNSLNHHQLQVYNNPYISHPQHHYHSAPPPQYTGSLYHQYYNHQHHHHHHHPLYHNAYSRPYQTVPYQQQQQHNFNLFQRQRQIQNHNKKYSTSEASSEQLKSMKETDTPNSVKIPSIKSSIKSTINWIAKTFCFCFTDDQLNTINFDTNSNKIVIK